MLCSSFMNCDIQGSISCKMKLDYSFFNSNQGMVKMKIILLAMAQTQHLPSPNT